jgi:phenylpropionate dioxygenase-like ring-hydroxylating dioxygenase large terminal subunit
MLVTQQPVLKRFWYPVMRVEKLTTPQSFQLLGEKLVLWLTDTGEPAAVADRCCHRSAQLSLGQVVEGHIRCPYHGWSFDGTGACVNVPQFEPGQAIPKSYRVHGYRCAVRYDYVWICLDDEPLQPIPDFPEATKSEFRLLHEFYETWQCSGLRLMENSFDNAHPHFVHWRTFGVQQEPIPPRPDVLEKTEFGLRMRYELPVFNTDEQKKNLQMETERTVRISEGLWFMPFTRKLQITYPNGLIHSIVTIATPICDRASQIIQFCFRNDTEAEAKAEDVIAFDRAVTLEDQAILESTDFDTPLNLQAEQHMPSDQPGILMRQQLAALLKQHGEVEQRQDRSSSEFPVSARPEMRRIPTS